MEWKTKPIIVNQKEKRKNSLLTALKQNMQMSAKPRVANPKAKNQDQNQVPEGTRDCVWTLADMGSKDLHQREGKVPFCTKLNCWYPHWCNILSSSNFKGSNIDDCQRNLNSSFQNETKRTYKNKLGLRCVKLMLSFVSLLLIIISSMSIFLKLFEMRTEGAITHEWNLCISNLI